MNRNFQKQLVKGETNMSATVIDANGRPRTAIEPGRKVRLRGDDNSPEMIVVGMIVNQQGEAVGAIAGYFSKEFREGANYQPPQFLNMQAALDAFELV